MGSRYITPLNSLFGVSRWIGNVKFFDNQNDVIIKSEKAIYKEISSQIMKIDLESQTSSRIVVLVELNYLERIVKSSGELVNETILNPLKVKYILGFSKNSWKMVDFVSGL